MSRAKGVEEIDEIDGDGSNSCSQDIVDERGGNFADFPGEVKQDDPAQQLFSNSKESKTKSRKKKKKYQCGSTNRNTSKNIENMEVMKAEPRRPPSASCFPRHEQTSPWLIFFSHGKKGKLHTLYSLESRRSYRKSIPQLVSKSCKAFAHGWLLMQDWVTAELTLLNPTTMERIDLPAPPEVSADDHIYNDRYSSWVITAPLTCASCIILISYHTDPLFMFCYVHERKWRKARYPSTGEDGGLRRFAICDGIIYACTPVNTTPCVVSFDLYKINIKPIPVPQPYVPFYGLYYSLLGGFGGDLYSVNFIDVHYTRLITNVNIFKMNFDANKWVKVETIGELAFFVDNVSESFLCFADNVPGIKKDCVYYMGSDDFLYRYDLATRGITMETSFRGLKDPVYDPCWLLPLPAS